MDIYVFINTLNKKKITVFRIFELIFSNNECILMNEAIFFAVIQ